MDKHFALKKLIYLQKSIPITFVVLSVLCNIISVSCANAITTVHRSLKAILSCGTRFWLNDFHI